MTTDLAIIGAGIAGVNAAVYAKRAGLDFVFFESKAVGGQLFFIENANNYIGMGKETKGSDLIDRLSEALRDSEIKIINEEITSLEISGKYANLGWNKNLCQARAVIAATGAQFKRLGVRGEDEFLGKGVSYCAICDGFFFKNKDVAVIGGGNTAVQEALYLAETCRKVYLVHRGSNLRAMDYLQRNLTAKNNIELVLESVVKEIKGADSVKEAVVENKSGVKRSLPVSGVFIAIGMKPNTDIFRGLITMEENGFIVTGEEMNSSCDFIWACGDCRKRPLRQLITAAGEGAVAALSAYRYLKNGYISV